MNVCLFIATIPPRRAMLSELLASAGRQTRLPDQIVIAEDRNHEGKAVVLNRALDLVTTDFLALMDDDDRMLPHHIERLMAYQAETEAAAIWPEFELEGVNYAPEEFLGIPLDQPFDRERLERENYIPAGGSLIATEALQEVGGICVPGSQEWPHDRHEDWGTWKKLADAGYRFDHLREVTWVWRIHGHGTPTSPGNTSGQPDRWM